MAFGVGPLRIIRNRRCREDRISTISTRPNCPAIVPPPEPRRDQMHCVKLLGQRLAARDFNRQVAGFKVRVAVLNSFTALGTPITETVGQVCSGIGEARLSKDLCNRADTMASKKLGAIQSPQILKSLKGKNLIETRQCRRRKVTRKNILTSTRI